MATSESPCVRSVTIPRCTTERSWFVTDMAVRGNTLAVCGYDYRTYTQSFIDLFTLNDPGSSPFMTHLFPKPSDHPRWRHRRVSFLDDSRIVTVCDDLVKVYHIKADLSELSRTVNLLQYTPVKCMTVREEAIFIGWYESKEVIVFDFNLNEIKTITLEGIEGYPVDITVYGDDLFISTYSSSSSRRASSRYNMEGKLVHEYKAPGYSYPHSITVSGLVYILWDFFHVVVYSLSDSQQLMSFNVDESHTIRIVDVNRLLTVNRRAGEVREYSMTQLCTFENLKRTLCRVMSPIDCAELKRFFKITDLDMSTNGNESRDIVAGAQDDRAAHLLAILETKGFIGSDNLDGLKKAFQHLGTAHVSMLRSQLESFQLHSIPSQSEIRSNGPSTFYPASTNNSAPKRRAPPYSGTNVEPHSKRKNTSSSELEQEDSTSGNTTLQFEIFQQSNPAPNQLVSITSTIPNRGGNPFAKGFVAALNDLPQTSQSLTTSLPMTQLEKQSPSNRQVIPSERSDSSRQIDSLTAQVRSVHELQSGTSSDTLAGGQHLQPEPSISEPSSSQVGGPSNYRPPREVDRSVIIGESRLVLQESSVEPELTAQEDYDSSAPSAWRGGSTSGDIRGLLQTPLSTSEGQAGLSTPLMPSSEQMETLRPNVLTDPSEETTELPGVQTNAELAKMNEQINQVYSLLTDISQRLPPGLRDSSSSLGESSRSSQLPRCHPSTSADPLSSLQDHEKQAILVYKDKTDDRVALVKELVPIFFTEEERRTQNCQGKGLCDGKDEFTQLSKEKLQKMREIIFYLCPVRSIKERETVEEKEWKRLCSEIDLFNRHFRGNLTRQAKSKSKRRKSDK